MQGNGIKHILCASYHPASNGLADRFVQTFKRAMKAGEKDGPSLIHHLTRFLLRYRSTPHSTTNVAPSELFLGRKLRTLFDLLKPDIETRVLSKQADQKGYQDKRAKPCYFSPNHPVMVGDFRLNTDKWIPGTVVESLGSLTYRLKVEIFSNVILTMCWNDGELKNTPQVKRIFNMLTWLTRQVTRIANMLI